MSVPVAIVGVAARFPGALSTDEFWRNLVAGVDSITRSTEEELAAVGVPEHVRRHPRFVPAEPRVPAFDELDAPLFGFSPREAREADPQLRLFVECCHAAVEDAGYDPFGMTEPVAVFGAGGAPVYVFENLGATREPSNQGLRAMLNNGDYLATQASFRFNFTGPAMTVLSACSSSLTAAHLAAQALADRHCDVALAGGSSLELDAPYGYFYAPGSVRSPDGVCRPFDASGGGTVFGGGAGVVVMKRLDDAVAAGDHIYAVVRGVGINNDGSEKVSYGAPSLDGQVACVRAALANAGVRPSELSYVEAHGTGTSVGDPIELAALREVWTAGGDLPPGYRCGIGSVKSNIGHAVQGAGVAGLIKVALAFEHEVLPPSINVRTVMSELADGSPFELVQRPRPWPRVAGTPRLAGISSFGAGGTNVHLVLEEPPPATPTPESGRARVVIWSAETEAAADEQAPVLAAHLGGTDAYEDSVTTLQRGRHTYRVRRAAVVSGPDSARSALTDPAALLHGKAKAAGARVAFAFPGQGSLVPGFGVALAESEPVFADRLATSFTLLGSRGAEYERLWRDCGDPRELANTGVAQPILFALELALSQTLAAWGVRPDVVTGHSLGELVAATVAGVLTPSDAAAVVLERADAMQAMPTGSMVAVFAAENEVRDRLPAELDVAAVNGDREIVVSGPHDAVAAFVGALRDDRIRSAPLRTSHAFHSRSMTKAKDHLLDVFAQVDLRRPRVPLVSAARGELVDEQATDPAFWADQLVTPVRFAAAADALVTYAPADAAGRGLVVLETGPGQALTGMLAQHQLVRDGAVTARALFARPRGAEVTERTSVLSSLAAAWTSGVAVDWAEVDAWAPTRRVSVPGYRYQRRRYYVDAPLWRTGVPHDAEGAAGDDGVSARVDEPESDSVAVAPQPRRGEPADSASSAEPASPFSVLQWREAPRPADGEPATASATTVAVLPTDRDLARRVLVALQRTSRQVVAVRHGDQYSLRESSAVLDTSDDRQLRRLLDDLADRGSYPDRVVHAATAEPWPDVTAATVDAQVASSFGAVLRLVQSLGRTGRATPELVVVTRGAVDVSGSEAVDPVKSTLVGLVRTLAVEDPSARVRLLDVDLRVPEADLVDELATPPDDPVVALRGWRRWTCAELPLTVRPGSGRAIRRKGTYLITGGLGGLGIELARGLARTGLQPTLVLTGRHGLPDGPCRARDVIEECDDLGASVKVLTADVADERDVRRLFDVVSARFGGLDGVFHLAGNPGGGVAVLRDPRDAEEVLRPKVRGAVLLREALDRMRAPDFWVSFGSRAAVSGLAGSADYAAANAFLDTLANAAGDGDTRMLTIDWPSWSGVGMAVPGLAAQARDQGGPLTYETVLDPNEHWVLNEHRVEGVAVLPGTGHLDLVVRAFRHVHGDATRPLTIQNAVFTAALAVERPTPVRVSFTGAGDGWSFELRSGPDGASLHSFGRIRWADDEAVREFDVATLRETLSDGEAVRRFSDATRMFDLGPRWHSITREVNDDDLTLIDLSLPAEFHGDLADHPLHPALLDGATASARLVTEGKFVPFSYGKLVLRRDLPATMLSYIRRKRTDAGTIVADIDVVSPDGALLVEITDFTMRAVDADGFGRADQSAPPRKHAAERPAPAQGIEPEVGVALTMALLDARTPNQVVVRPFRDGAPLPLDAGVLAPARRDVGTGQLTTLRPTTGAATVQPTPDDRTGGSPLGAPGVAGPPSEDGTADPIARMRALWEEVLGALEIEPDDNFFDIGGTSLSAIELVARIRDEFGADLSIAALLDAPTLEGLTRSVAG